MASPVVAAGMESRNRESSSITSWPSGINHEVFLNFRGTDTRKVFTDLLYKKLKNAGIEVFKDDEKLRAGEEINQGLKDAIKRSRISIAIFSKDYASSKSCLMELVQMWECRISNGQTIIPIFYDVSPYAVTHQAGDFATSFEKHEEDDDVDSNTIKTWKEVLQLVGGISGYDRDNINGGHVSDLLEKVLKRVMEELKKDDQDVTDKLVGIDLHVQEMMTKLGVVYSHGQATKVCGEDVRVLGICGMQGVGKTTLAKVVFNKTHKLFDGCSFLECLNSEEVKVSQEMLIADLQKENRAPLRSYGEGIKKIASLFTNMKVLIVLDDVHDVEQIKGLAGKLTWFGLGSRIIVTTDNQNVLNVFEDGALEKYEVEPMRDQDALQLFRKHAFEGNAPQDISEYDYLSLDIVKAIGGLPGAIVRQASYLCRHRKDIQIWRSTLGFLKKDHEDKVEAASKDLRRERGGVAEISQEVGTLQQEVGVSVEEFRRMSSENKKLTETLNVVLLGYNSLQSQLINLAKEISVNEVMESRKRKFEDYNDLELWKRPTESVKSKTSVAYVQVDASDTSLVVKDGYQWRKYAQKVTRDNPSPAAYFKCSFAPSCPVKKKVQRSFKDPSLLIATYQGDHNHRCPSQGAKPASAPPPISPSSVKPSNHDASLDLVQRGFSNPEEKPKQETEVGTPPQFLLQEMVSSLVGDPNFTASLAEAISGAMFDRSRTDS